MPSSASHSSTKSRSASAGPSRLIALPRSTSCLRPSRAEPLASRSSWQAPLRLASSIARNSPPAIERQTMANTLYTAKAHVTGGRSEGHGKTSDGALEVELRLPEEMGGSGGGTNPEQLFAVGYAACFEGALGVVARRAKAEPGDVAIDSEVTLTPNSSGGFLLGVTLNVTLPGIKDPATAAELVRGAHEVCPYS